MKAKRKIVIFEDDPGDGKKILEALRKVCGDAFEIHPFEPPKGDIPQKPYEDVLKTALEDIRSTIALIVTDRDLSKTNNLSGLSEAAVSKLAQDWALPICLYARNQERELDRHLRWGEGRISVDFSKGPDHLADQVCVIARGFEQIRSAIQKIPKTALGKSPGKILAKVLGKNTIADRLSLYGAGDQQMLAEILPYFKTGRAGELKERMPRVLGNWLWESIFRFPGILVNEIAAASYLDIDPKDFEKPAIRTLFKDAVYSGPFATNRKPYWWRHELDEILDRKKSASGLALAKMVDKRARSCRCSMDPSLRAGFYCIVSEQPVSAERSRGNLSWLPSAADLSRISDKLFDQLAPWLALY